MPVREVWAWYTRLAKAIGKRPVSGGGTPLASLLLDRYLRPQAASSGQQQLYVISAPAYVKTLSQVTDTLTYHRRVYLTQEKARLGSSKRWAGIKPRWENPGKYGWTKGKPLSMHYECLVEIPLRWQITGNDEERDILYGLGLGFQLYSEVTVSVSKPASQSHLDVTFNSFLTKIKDIYDFNYNEHITVPNPDFGSSSSDAVCSNRNKITVYHRNAQRMETAGLAAPYSWETQPWVVSDPSICGPGRVTL